MSKTPHHLYLALGLIIVLVLSTGMTFALYELTLIERNVNKSAAASSETLAMVNQALKGTHKNGDDGLLALSRNVLQNGAAAANALKQTLQDTNKIAKAQEAKTTQLADSSILLVKSGGEAVVKLGASIDELNGAIADVRKGTLPKLDAGVDALTGLVTDLRPTAQASTKLLDAATEDAKAFHGTITLANETLSNQDIAATLHSFKAMADTGADTMTHVDGAVKNTEQLAGEFRDMFKPKGKVSFFEQLAITAAKSMFGPIGGAAVSHFFPLRVEVAR